MGDVAILPLPKVFFRDIEASCGRNRHNGAFVASHLCGSVTSWSLLYTIRILVVKFSEGLFPTGNMYLTQRLADL
jgi:hypothetical protein